MKNIIAFGGSNSKASINKKLAVYTSSLFSNENVKIIDLNDFEMPIFGVDREKEFGFPDEAHQFIKLIKESDLIILSLAEHNGSYSTAFKNVLDWASRIEGQTFQKKGMILMATSPGARGGKSVLEAAKSRFPFQGANIIGSFSLPEFNKNFDSSKGILADDLSAELMKIVEDGKAFLKQT